jgi:hypothetical protein
LRARDDAGNLNGKEGRPEGTARGRGTLLARRSLRAEERDMRMHRCVTSLVAAAIAACGTSSSLSMPLAPSASPFSIAPASVGVLTGRTVSFTTSPAIPVDWSVEEASSCGTISTAGVYSAPGAVPSGGDCHVSAASKADASVRAKATVTVFADAVGAWVPVSPPVDYAYVALSNYGLQGIDGAKPDAPKTLYVGTCLYGVWKTTDGGDTWAHTNDSFTGRNWSLVVDPTSSDVVYTLDGYGTGGVWKTTNGGASWTNVQHNIATNDLSHIEIDPQNHLHLLVTEHSGNYDLWETQDGGATWTNKGHPWGGHNAFVYFLNQDDAGNPSSSYWLGFAESNGLWRTTNGGASWTQVSSALSRSHGGAGLYRAANGALFASVNLTIGRSTDNGRTWTDLSVAGNLPTSGDAYAGIVGDGARIWAMRMNTGVAAQGPYRWVTTPEMGDGTVWTEYNGQQFADGPSFMVYDRVNHVIYSSQWSTGLWRLKP